MSLEAAKFFPLLNVPQTQRTIETRREKLLSVRHENQARDVVVSRAPAHLLLTGGERSQLDLHGTDEVAARRQRLTVRRQGGCHRNTEGLLVEDTRLDRSLARQVPEA